MSASSSWSRTAWWRWPRRRGSAFGTDFGVGTMIELPRACFIADQIARHADFFSFGTNDLTQCGLGFSRDDIEGRIIPRYVEEKIVDGSPFATIDQAGVGELVRIAVERGRRERPDLELGVCGEHGGDPESIRFFHDVGARLRELLAVPSADRSRGGRPGRDRGSAVAAGGCGAMASRTTPPAAGRAPARRPSPSPPARPRDITPLPDLAARPLAHGAGPQRAAGVRRSAAARATPGCPAGENIQGWMAHVKVGEHEQAWRLLTADNPFPAIHGRVCYHPCESVCNRAELDSAALDPRRRAVPRRPGARERGGCSIPRSRAAASGCW